MVAFSLATVSRTILLPQAGLALQNFAFVSSAYLEHQAHPITFSVYPSNIYCFGSKDSLFTDATVFAHCRIMAIVALDRRSSLVSRKQLGIRHTME